MGGANGVEREWSIREYREGDEEQILALRGIALSGPRDKQWWKWMNRDGPACPALIMLAEANHKIVGQFATIIVPLKIGDKATKGGHGFDVMVHPDYRRQGIFKTLGTTLAESVLNSDMSIRYGTPNKQSNPGLVKWLHDLDICEVPTLVKVIDWGEVLNGRYRIPVFAGKLLGYAWERITNRSSSLKNAGVEIEQVASFDERIDKFWLKASQIKKIMVIKDMKYLNWRYVAKPGNEYKIFLAKKQDEIAGFIMFKLERGVLNRGFIIDLLALPGEDMVAEALIIRAEAYLKAEGAAMISCLMLEDTPYYRTLRKLGFIRRSGPGLCARIFDQNISKELVTNPSNWYYVMGDGDSI